MGRTWTNLSDINQHIIRVVSIELLGMKTQFDDSRAYDFKTAEGDSVIELLKKIGATAYVSGPAAKLYLDQAVFAAKGINLEWMSYDGVLKYPQRYPALDHALSIIDLFFNTRPDATEYILCAPKVEVRT